MLPVHDRRPPPVESGNELLEDKQKVTLHQAHGDCIASGFKNAQRGRLSHRLLTALFFLLCFECCVGLRHLPLSVAAKIGAILAGPAPRAGRFAFGLFLAAVACVRSSR